MAKIDNWIDSVELKRYREAVQRYLRGDLSEERFQAVRLQQGVYGQRQEGVNMVRIKLPGGCISPQQLDNVAGLLTDYSRENIASVTTRQDLQCKTCTQNWYIYPGYRTFAVRDLCLNATNT